MKRLEAGSGSPPLPPVAANGYPCVGSSKGYSKDAEGMPTDALLPSQPSLSVRVCEGARSMHLQAVSQQ